MKTENRNRNVVRLTESKLKQIVAESVRRVLNEIGDTHRGQFMLGRVYAKNNEKYDDPSAFKLANYAFDRKMDKNSFNGDWDNGAEHQRNMMKVTNNPYDFYKTGRNMQFDYDVARDKDMDTLGRKFIDFIEKHDGGVLLQTIVDYESGNQTGTPESGFPAVLGEFEDEVLGYDCSQSTKKELENAYNRWWYYAQGELMSEDD